ncbi:TPA: hypothetical protein ACSCX2_004266 [Aeromonas veronii]
MAYQVLQNAGPLPARRCPADPFPFGAWPVPADVVAMAIPAELLIGTASAPAAAGPADSPDLIPGRTWPAPAAADPDGVPGTAERRATAGAEASR